MVRGRVTIALGAGAAVSLIGAAPAEAALVCTPSSTAYPRYCGTIDVHQANPFTWGIGHRVRAASVKASLPSIIQTDGLNSYATIRPVMRRNSDNVVVQRFPSNGGDFSNRSEYTQFFCTSLKDADLPMIDAPNPCYTWPRYGYNLSFEVEQRRTRGGAVVATLSTDRWAIDPDGGYAIGGASIK